MNESPNIASFRLEERPPDERFVRKVVAALVVDRRRRRRLRLAAAGALLFFFFVGAGQRVANAPAVGADESYASLLAPSALEDLIPE